MKVDFMNDKLYIIEYIIYCLCNCSNNDSNIQNIWHKKKLIYNRSAFSLF